MAAPAGSPTPPGVAAGTAMVQVLPAYFDNATKLLTLEGHSYLGIVTYGQGALGAAQPRTAYSYIPEFEAHLGIARRPVEEVATELGTFFSQQWTNAGMAAGAEPMYFLVAGFDEGDTYGKVFQVVVPTAIAPVEQSPNDFGITWGGQQDFVMRVLNGVDGRAAELAEQTLALTPAQRDSLTQRWQAELGLPIPYQFLPLQDCVNLATFLVEMTATVQTWIVGIRGVGGDVDVAIITRTGGLEAVDQKRIHAWS